MTNAFPENACNTNTVPAIEWQHLDDVTDCAVEDVPAPIHDCPEVPYPAPVPQRLRTT